MQIYSIQKGFTNAVKAQTGLNSRESCMMLYMGANVLKYNYSRCTGIQAIPVALSVVFIFVFTNTAMARQTRFKSRHQQDRR